MVQGKCWGNYENFKINGQSPGYDEFEENFSNFPNFQERWTKSKKKDESQFFRKIHEYSGMMSFVIMTNWLK